MVRAIIFDCFGVITKDLWKEYKASLPDAQQEPAAELNRAYDRGQISRDEFVGELEQLTGRRPVEVEKLDQGDIIKNEELLAYISELKKDYKIGMLSNIASNWIKDSLLIEQEKAQFDAFVFSHDIGTVKPDRLAYEAVAEKLGVKMQDCVFIDDTELYCRAANEYGMKGIWYQNFPQLKSDLEQVLADSKN